MARSRDSRFGDFSSGNYYRPSLFGDFSFFPPVIKSLLIINVGVFLFFLFFGPLRLGDLSLEGLLLKGFALHPLGSGFYPWQLLTYMFIHGGIFHLLLNLFALWMFGMEIEHIWGSKKFLRYYLFCGVGGAFTNLFVAPAFGAGGPTVGASGAIYGILLAFALMFPDRYIFLFPFFVPVKSKYLVAFFILLALFSGVTGTEQGVAHFAHLGGAAFGYIYLLVDWRRMPFEGILRRAYAAWRSAMDKRKAYTPERYREVKDAEFYDIKEPREKTKEEIDQEKIDAILDKISVSGYQSLTDEEKRILFEASKKLN